MSNQPVVGVRIPRWNLRMPLVGPTLLRDLAWVLVAAAFVAAVIGIQPIPGSTEGFARIHVSVFRGLAGTFLAGAFGLFVLAGAIGHVKKGA